MTNIKENTNANVYDKNGNVLITKGLKVRHKKSGFIYTVQDVTKDNSGKIRIILRTPEMPRIKINKDFEKEQEKQNKPKKPKKPKVVLLHEFNTDSVYIELENIKENDFKKMNLSNGEFLSVDEDEFEREYEVT